MNVNDAKHDTADRIELLYDKTTLMAIHDRYGDATEIKRHVKTAAKTYEIRTALAFYKEERATYRTNDCVWNRLEWVADNDARPERVERL